MKFIAKKHYTFAELETRWECGRIDLIQAVIEGELIPSVHIELGKYRIYQFDVDHHGNTEHLSLCNPFDFIAMGGRSNFHYLIWPRRTGVNDCQFSYFSENATGHVEGDLCSELTTPVDIEQVLERGVFLAKEVARVEAKSGDMVKEDTTEKSLSNRERDTLLTIIAALCKEAKIDYTRPAKAAGMIQSTAATMGVSIGETTIEGHLKKIPDALATRMK